jgi:hypothetical protein
MLSDGDAVEFGLSDIAECHPSQDVEKPVCEAKTCPLESDLGHTANVTETVTLRVRVVLQKLDLDGYAARCRAHYLRGEQPVIRSSRRPQHLPDLTLLPIIASDQPYGGDIACPDPFEFTLRQVNHDKSMGAVREIKDGLTFRHCRPRAGGD